jgi:hypothetical protein
MPSKNRSVSTKQDSVLIESEGTVDPSAQKQIRAFIGKRLPKLEQVRDRLPLDLSRFVVQVVPEGFDIAVHYTLSGTSFYFAAGMSAAQRSTVRKLVDRFDPKTVLTTKNSFDLGILFCATWSPNSPEHLLAWRFYYTAEGAQTLLPVTLSFLPSLPAESAEICQANDIGEIYARGAEAHAATWSDLTWKGSKSPFKMRGVLFSPAEENSDLPTFVVDLRGSSKRRSTARSALLRAA